MLNDFGTLSVRAYTAGGALPVANATVRIMGAEEGNRDVSYSLRTDVDGTTERVRLPAPSAILSQSPSPMEPPFAVYDVEISATGFFSKKIFNVPVFAGINSSQQFNMIPESENYVGDLPLGNVYTIIPDNSGLN